MKRVHGYDKLTPDSGGTATSGVSGPVSGVSGNRRQWADFQQHISVPVGQTIHGTSFQLCTGAGKVPTQV